MRSIVRYAAAACVLSLPFLFVGCGTSGSNGVPTATVSVSPALAGNWTIAAKTAPASSTQIAGMGGSLFVSSSGAITGMLHALPAAGSASSSLCYATAKAIPVTGNFAAGNTLTLTSSPFAGNTLTVQGTYAAGSGSALPSLSNATYSITGPCAVAAQAVAATQTPTLTGSYKGVARFGANPSDVLWTTVFTQSTTPDSSGGYPLIGTSTFAADPCIVTPNNVNVTSSNVQYGTYISEDFVDSSTGTEVVVEGTSTDATNATIYLDSIKISNNTPAYSYCNDSGTGYLYALAPAVTPVFSPVAGTYTSAQLVSITSATTGASIYYTTDGSLPTSSSTPYSVPVTVSSSETLRAIAIAPGFSISAIASAAYVINTPTYGLSFNPSSITFPSTAVGFPSAPITVTITNTGSTTVTFNGFALAGANGGDFAEVNNCGLPLQPTQSCTAQLSATPQALGNRTGMFVVSSNAVGSPQPMNLLVTGANPSAGPVSLSTQTLDWTIAGVVQDVSLQNLGTKPLAIASITSTDPSFVVYGNTCGISVPAQSSCTISIVSNGANSNLGTIKNFSGRLTINDDASNGPQTVFLTSENSQTLFGYSDTNGLSTESPLVDFGLSAIGISKTIQLSINALVRGNQATVSSIVGGTNAGDFTPSPAGCQSGSNTLACSYPVTFTPSAAGIRTAKLLPTSQSGYIPLIGRAPAPGTAFSAPQTLTVTAKFGASGIASGSVPFTVVNTGTAPISFSLYPVTSPNPLEFNVTGNCTSIAAGASCTVTVAYNLTSPTNGRGTLLLKDDASGVSQTVAIVPAASYQILQTTPTSLIFGPQASGVTSPEQTFTVSEATANR